MSNDQKSVSNLLRTLSLNLIEAAPNSGLSFQKVNDILCKTIGSNPRELSFFHKIYVSNAISNRRKCLIHVIYNVSSTDFNLDTFLYDGNDIELKNNISHKFSEVREIKKLGKQYRKYNLAMGQESFWLRSDKTSSDEVIKELTETVKKSPPFDSVDKFNLSFTTEEKLESHGVSEKYALGVTLVAPTAPYLPIEVSYFVGCLNNPELKRNLFSRNSSYSLLDKSISENEQERLINNSYFHKNNLDINLSYKNMLSSMSTKGHFIFDIIHDSLQFDIENVKQSYNFSSYNGEKVEIPFQAIYLTHKTYRGGIDLTEADVMKQHDKYVEISNSTRFSNGYFELSKEFGIPLYFSLNNESKSNNFLEKAIELSSLLEKWK